MITSAMELVCALILSSAASLVCLARALMAHKSVRESGGERWRFVVIWIAFGWIILTVFGAPLKLYFFADWKL